MTDTITKGTVLWAIENWPPQMRVGDKLTFSTYANQGQNWYWSLQHENGYEVNFCEQDAKRMLSTTPPEDKGVQTEGKEPSEDEIDSEILRLKRENASMRREIESLKEFLRLRDK